MSSKHWEKVLCRFKAKEKPESVLLVAGSPQLLRIVVAWMNTPVSKAKRLSRLNRKDENGLWKWLWENARYSRDELTMRIPSFDKDAEQKLNALIANRLLYPDGTINRYIAKYLREKTISCFPKTFKRQCLSR